MIFICCNISLSRAQSVDPGFVPCDIGVINSPAICVRTASCTTTSWLWGTRVAIISGVSHATAACPGTSVYNRASIKLLRDYTGLHGMAESQLFSAAGPTMSYAYTTQSCSGTKSQRGAYLRGCPSGDSANNASSSQEPQCNSLNCPTGFSFSSNRCGCVSDSNPPPDDMPSNCTVPEPDGSCPPGLISTGGLCCDINDQEGCEEALYWDFTNNTCSDSPTTQAQCDGAN